MDHMQVVMTVLYFALSAVIVYTSTTGLVKGRPWYVYI